MFSKFITIKTLKPMISTTLEHGRLLSPSGGGDRPRPFARILAGARCRGARARTVCGTLVVLWASSSMMKKKKKKEVNDKTKEGKKNREKWLKLTKKARRIEKNFITLVGVIFKLHSIMDKWINKKYSPKFALFNTFLLLYLLLIYKMQK